MTYSRLGKVGDVPTQVTRIKPTSPDVLGNNRAVLLNATDLAVLAASSRLGCLGRHLDVCTGRAEDLKTER